MSISTESIQQYIGTSLIDDAGHRIGKIGGVFLDDVTGRPEWVTVSTGFFGTNESFVPVAGASAGAGGLTVPYSKDKVKDAPNVDIDKGHLSSDEEANLYRYYGLEYDTDNAPDTGHRETVDRDAVDRDPVDRDPADLYGGAGTRAEVGARGLDDTSNVGRTDLIQRDADYDDSDATGLSAGPNFRRGTRIDANAADNRTDASDLTDTSDRAAASHPADRIDPADRTDPADRIDPADRTDRGVDSGLVVTRSEEQLNVGTERVQTGKARLRKWVETEHQQVDVPVRTEKAVLVTETVDPDTGEAVITEGEEVVTLSQERPVVRTETVPVERVRIAKETHEETRTVGGDVRKERVDLDTDSEHR